MYFYYVAFQFSNNSYNIHTIECGAIVFLIWESYYSYIYFVTFFVMLLVAIQNNVDSKIDETSRQDITIKNNTAEATISLLLTVLSEVFL